MTDAEQPKTSVPPTPVFRADQPVAWGMPPADDPALLAAWREAGQVVASRESARSVARPLAVLGMAAVVITGVMTVGIRASSGEAVLALVVCLGIAAACLWCWTAPSPESATVMAVAFGLAVIAVLLSSAACFSIGIIPFAAFAGVAAYRFVDLPEAEPLYVDLVADAVRDAWPPFVPWRRRADVVSFVERTWASNRPWRAKLRPEVLVAILPGSFPMRVLVLGRSEISLEPRGDGRGRTHTARLGAQAAKTIIAIRPTDLETLHAWMAGATVDAGVERHSQG